MIPRHTPDRLALESAVNDVEGDALLIESQAKMRLADEYDAAQDRGEVQKAGGDRTSIVRDENNAPATIADLGITRTAIHEARQFRDAETENPGVIRRAINERLSAGQEPTKAAIREAVTGRGARLSEAWSWRPYPAPCEPRRGYCDDSPHEAEGIRIKRTPSDEAASKRPSDRSIDRGDRVMAERLMGRERMVLAGVRVAAR